MEWGNFDAVAHFDVIKKFGYMFFGSFRPEKYEDIIKPILQKMIKKGIGLELNTQAIEKRCNEIFPHSTILEWAVELGMQHFTVSSDSHRPEKAGNYISLALETAKKVGITHISTYNKRKPTLHKII